MEVWNQAARADGGCGAISEAEAFRKHFESGEGEAVENGGGVESKISQKNNVTHLVVKSLENTSQKILKAKEMGIEITTKEGLLEMF